MRLGLAAIAGWLAAALIAGAYVVLSWSHHVATLGGDSAQYLLAAQYFSPYQPNSAAVDFYSKLIIYPPLFPWILGLIGAGESILVAHLFVAACVLGSIAALYGFLRIEALPPRRAAVAAMLFGLLPGTLLMSLDVWTENLYLLLSLLALLGASRAEKRGETGNWVLSATAVGLAGLTRAAAVPLLAAFCLHLLIRRPWRWPALMALALLPFCIWVVIGSAGQTGIGGYTDHLLNRYGDAAWTQFLGYALTELRALLDAWLFAWLLEGRNPALVWIVLGFGVLCLTAAAIRLVRLRFDAIYVTLYLGMLMVWPHPEEALRYGYVLLPVLMAQGLVLLHAMWPVALRRYAWVPVLLLALAVLPSLALMVQRFTEPLPSDAAAGKRTWGWFRGNRVEARQGALEHARTLAHLAELGQVVPPEDCVFSIKPPLVMLYASRVSKPPPKSSVSESRFKEEISHCGFAHVVPFGSPNFAEPFYPLERLGARAQPVLVQSLQSGADSPVVSVLLRLSR